MVERPILFSGPMVRAILEGRKTQTRRLVKGSPAHCFPMKGRDGQPDGTFFVSRPDSDRVGNGGVLCPFGQPGDRLWVRETWGDGSRFYPHSPILYRADSSEDFGTTCRDAAEIDRVMKREHAPLEGCRCYFRWRPSIHMPRRASRITLEVTGVRVERLQDITEEDAKAEGVEQIVVDGGGVWRDYELGDGTWCVSARGAFASLWRSLSGAESWDATPWVWVVEFKRVTP